MIVGRIKASNNCKNRSKGSPRRGEATLYQKVEIFAILGRVPTPGHRLAWNFARPRRTKYPSDVPKFTSIGLASRPFGAKMLIFGMWVNTESLPLCGILPIIRRLPRGRSKQSKTEYGRRRYASMPIKLLFPVSVRSALYLLYHILIFP